MSAADKKKLKTSRGDLNSFLFFLILATLFWVLTKFSKEYEQDLSAQMEFTSLPDNAVINKGANTAIPLRLEASGFEFLYYKIKKPVVTIDLADIDPGPDAQWKLPKTSIESQASQQFNHQVTVSVPQTEITLPIQLLAKRKVAVIPAVELNFKDGYSSLNELKITPDSVMVIGPEGMISSMESIKTEAREFKGLDADIEGELAIALPDGGEQLKVTPERISYSLDVQEFIENELTVPITLVGNEDNLAIQLFPSAVKVRYTVNFDQYKNVSAEDFEVICDLSKAAEGSNLLTPELITYPEGVQKLSFSPKEVEFIVIQ